MTLFFNSHAYEHLADTNLLLQASFWLAYADVDACVAFTATALPIVVMLREGPVRPSCSKQRHFASCSLMSSIIVREGSLLELYC